MPEDTPPDATDRSELAGSPESGARVTRVADGGTDTTPPATGARQDVLSDEALEASFSDYRD